MMRLWKLRVTDACPSCGQRGEDNTHILDCRAADAMAEWDAVSIRVYEWLDSHDSYSELARLVMRALENWKDKTPVEYDVESDFSGMQKFLQHQKRIGWWLFLNGYLTVE